MVIGGIHLRLMPSHLIALGNYLNARMCQMNFPEGPLKTGGPPWFLGALLASLPNSDVSSAQGKAS